MYIYSLCHSLCYKKLRNKEQYLLFTFVDKYIFNFDIYPSILTFDKLLREYFHFIGL